MGLVVTNLKYGSAGTQAYRTATVTFDSSYPTGGETLTAAALGLSRISSLQVNQVDGYVGEVVYPSLLPATVKIKMWEGGVSGFTPAGTNANESAHTHGAGSFQAAAQIWTAGAYAPAGTNSTSAVTGTGTADAQTFTGSASALNLASPVFAGTGYTTAGQVTTTTDNQTMTLNQCAGMWLIGNTASEAPALIVSNTAVTGAPAVLTCIGTPPVTDAGGYKIVATTPVGTNGSSTLSGLALTAAAQTFSGTPAVLTGTNAVSAVTGTSGAGSAHTHIFTGTAVAGAPASEVANGTNLSTVSMEIVAFGL